MQLKKEALQTIQLALPIIFGEIAQMALHLIDTAMIGAISYVQLAAASLVMNVLAIPFVLGIGMTISIAQFVSLAKGANDKQKVSHYFYNGFILCAFFAVLISLGLYSSASVIQHLKQDPEVVRLAYPFLKVMSLSLIPMLLFMTLKQFTDGLQFPRTAMLLSILSLPINVFLNWLFIFGHWGFPRMEMMGAAYATLITRSLIFIALALVILKHPIYKSYIIIAKNQWKLKFKTLKDLVHIGLPSGLQIGMEAGAFVVSGIIMGTIGVVEQAAHQIALSSASFTFMVSMGLAQAGSIRASTALGAQAYKQIARIGKSTAYTALGYGVFCALLFISLRNQLPYLFNNKTEVIHLASILFIYAAIFQISDASQAIGAGLLRGIKDVKVPTLLIFISYWVLGIPAGYYFAFYTPLGAQGIWLGFIIGLSFSSVFLNLRFFSRCKKMLALQKQNAA